MIQIFCPERPILQSGGLGISLKPDIMDSHGIARIQALGTMGFILLGLIRTHVMERMMVSEMPQMAQDQPELFSIWKLQGLMEGGTI